MRSGARLNSVASGMSMSTRGSGADSGAASLAAVGGGDTCARGVAVSRRAVCPPGVLRDGFGAVLDAAFDAVLNVRPVGAAAGLWPGAPSMLTSLSLSHLLR